MQPRAVLLCVFDWSATLAVNHAHRISALDRSTVRAAYGLLGGSAHHRKSWRKVERPYWCGKRDAASVVVQARIHCSENGHAFWPDSLAVKSSNRCARCWRGRKDRSDTKYGLFSGIATAFGQSGNDRSRRLSWLRRKTRRRRLWCENI